MTDPLKSIRAGAAGVVFIGIDRAVPSQTVTRRSKPAADHNGSAMPLATCPAVRGADHCTCR